MQKNPITILEEMIKNIEKEYKVKYSSKFFSRFAFYYLRKNGISADKSIIYSRYLLQDSQRKISPYEMQRGNLYYFMYNPINKKAKHYDMSPCIVYLGRSKEILTHFYGLNLNYLNPSIRHQFFSRLPFVYNENMFKNISKTQQRIFGDVQKNKKTQFTKVDTLFGYKELKNLFPVEHKHLIKRYSMEKIISKPTLIPFRIAKIVTMLDLYHFNTRNPHPIWRKVFDSITEESKSK